MKPGSLSLQLYGYRLTTAEILYRMPDHPSLLQSYIWQELDMAPKFPRLGQFLRFWQDNLEGELYAVRVGSRQLIAPPKTRHRGFELTIH